MSYSYETNRIHMPWLSAATPHCKSCLTSGVSSTAASTTHREKTARSITFGMLVIPLNGMKRLKYPNVNVISSCSSCIIHHDPPWTLTMIISPLVCVCVRFSLSFVAIMTELKHVVQERDLANCWCLNGFSIQFKHPETRFNILALYPFDVLSWYYKAYNTAYAYIVLHS